MAIPRKITDVHIGATRLVHAMHERDKAIARCRGLDAPLVKALLGAAVEQDAMAFRTLINAAIRATPLIVEGKVG